MIFKKNISVILLLTLNLKAFSAVCKDRKSKNNNDFGNEISIADIEECTTEKCIKSSKRILSNLDTSVNPCEDFYQFSCGGWMSEKASKNIKNTDVNKENSDKINEIFQKLLESDYQVNEKLSEAEKEYDEKTFNKLKTIYTSCLNEQKLNKNKNELLIDYINNLNITETLTNNDSLDGLAILLANLHNLGVNLLFSVDSNLYTKDENLLNRNIISIKFNSYLHDTLKFAEYQSYYDESGDEKAHYENILLVYKKYIENVLKKIFEKNSNKIEEMVESVIKVDKMIVHQMNKKDIEYYTNDYNITETESYPTSYDFMDIEEYPTDFNYMDNEEYPTTMIYEEDINDIINNLDKINDINEKFPYINWKLYFEKRFEFYGIEKSFIEKLLFVIDIKPEVLKDIIEELDIKDLINYSEWMTIESLIDLVSTDLENLKKDFSSFLRNGKQNENGGEKEEEEANRDVHYKCIDQVNEIMPMALGKYYVEMNSLDINKQEIEIMINNIKEVMMNRISELKWLDDSTREYVIELLSKLKENLGYPDYILDPEKLYKKYELINVDPNVFFNNLINKNIYMASESFLININSTNVNHFEDWKMPPQLINAYYDFLGYEMFFPAAHFQDPYFNINQPYYLNYGSIGDVIGHELTHAYDGDNIGLWSNDDKEEFNEYSQCFIDQYDSYSVKINGKLYHGDGKKTLNENLADNGGLSRSYEAWKMLFKKDPQKAKEQNKKLPGLSEYSLEQLFFIAFGQVYCNTDDEYFYSNENNVHSPNRFRVNGSVSNNKYFAKAFNCPSNSPMNPSNKCILW